MTERIVTAALRRTPYLWAGAALALGMGVPAPASAATWSLAHDAAFPQSYRTFLDENSGAGAAIQPRRPFGLASWSTPGRAETAPATTIATLTAGGTLGRASQADGNLIDFGVDAAGTATATFVGGRSNPAENDEVFEAGITWKRFGRDGRVRSSGSFSDAFVGSEPRVATNFRGDAVVVWVDSVADDQQVLRVSTHRVGQRGFTAPATLGVDTTPQPSTSVSLSRDGRVLIAYAGTLPERGSTAPPAKGVPAQTTVFTGRVGARLTGPTAVGRRGDTNVFTAFDGRGRGYVVWQNAGGRHSPQLATLAPGATRFSKAVDLDPGKSEYAEPLLAADPGPAGGAVVAWSQNAPYPLVTAAIGADGKVTARQTVGRGLPVDLAVRNHVAALATDDGQGYGRVQLFVRDRSASRFGPEERPSRKSLSVAPGQLTIDPDGRVRLTADLDDSAKRLPRLLTYLRSPG